MRIRELLEKEGKPLTFKEVTKKMKISRQETAKHIKKEFERGEIARHSTYLPNTLHPIGVYMSPEWPTVIKFDVDGDVVNYEWRVKGVVIATGIIGVKRFSLEVNSKLKDRIKLYEEE